MASGTEVCGRSVISSPEFLALKHKSRLLGHSSNPVCGFSMMEQVWLCAVWPTENWLGPSLNQIQGWTTVRKSYSRALEQGPLLQREKSDDANAVVVCYISTLLTFFHNFLGGGGVAFCSRIIYIQSAKEGSIVLSRTVTASDC